jgi:hypothetical protein
LLTLKKVHSVWADSVGKEKPCLGGPKTKTTLIGLSSGHILAVTGDLGPLRRRGGIEAQEVGSGVLGAAVDDNWGVGAHLRATASSVVAAGEREHIGSTASTLTPSTASSAAKDVYTELGSCGPYSTRFFRKEPESLLQAWLFACVHGHRLQFVLKFRISLAIRPINYSIMDYLLCAVDWMGYFSWSSSLVCGVSFELPILFDLCTKFVD